MHSSLIVGDRAVALAQRGADSSSVLTHGEVAFEVQSDGKILIAAGHVENLTGCATASLQGMALRALLPQEEHSRLHQLLTSAAEACFGLTGFTIVRRDRPSRSVKCEVAWWTTDGAPGEGRLRLLFREPRTA